MRTRTIWSNIAFMAIFGTLGLTRFSENVRTVQVLGLFSSGAVVGAALVLIVTALRAKQKPE